MSNLKQLGANIRSLRLAYGETQEELGAAIYVEKNTVSYYENGKREPSRDTLELLAKHFMLSVEELTNSDLTSVRTITVDKDAIWKSIDIILPIISSEKALENADFNKAYVAHRALYDELHRVSLDGIDKVDVCLDGYLEAVEDDEIKAEAAANILAIWYLLTGAASLAHIFIKNQPAALKQVTSRDEKARKTIENRDPSFETDTKAILEEIKDDDMKEMMTEMMTIVKRSAAWSDLADYYLALQYVWNIADNDLDSGFNQRIGMEMMNSFITVNNLYASRFVKYCFDSVTGNSSQLVNDK